MTTKKQQRAISEAKAAKDLADSKRTGLDAQRKDQDRQEVLRQRAEAGAAKSANAKKQRKNKEGM